MGSPSPHPHTFLTPPPITSGHLRPPPANSATSSTTSTSPNRFISRPICHIQHLPLAEFELTQSLSFSLSFSLFLSLSLSLSISFCPQLFLKLSDKMAESG